MKNFSEALDTKVQLDYKLVLSPIGDNGDPKIAVEMNHEVKFHGNLERDTTITGSILNTDKFSMAITLKDKIYNNEKETAVIINLLEIDGKEIIPRYVHKSVYENDHDSSVITNYLGYNGQWKLSMDGPFYIWLHEQDAKGMLIY